MNTAQSIDRRQFLRHSATGAAIVSLAAASMPAAWMRADTANENAFDYGGSLAGWRKPTGSWMAAKSVALDPANASAFTIAPGEGILVNGADGRTVNLVTEREFGDAALHVEFCIPKHSNSGIYLMGRYEVQVYDSFGVEKDAYPGLECGGLYPRGIREANVDGHSPLVNASKPAGEWQSFDIVFLAPRFDAAGKKTQCARFVKVVHNGRLIHANVDLTGPTRSSLFEDEKPAGPILLQGDHGPVAYRNVRIQAIGAPEQGR